MRPSLAAALSCWVIALVGCEATPIGPGRALDAGVDPSLRDATPPRSDAGPPQVLRDAGPVDTCPPPPRGTPEPVQRMLSGINAIRRAMRISCATHVPSLVTAAERHCAYYARHRDTPRCAPDPSTEVTGCETFSGATYADRMSAAGYTGVPASELMHLLGDPEGAARVWLDSVWHRVPLLSPWVSDFGYGGAMGCDTLELGRGIVASDELVATFPYDGQEGVPRTFNGREGPTPPAPPEGFPSGYPVTIYLRGTVTTHEIVAEGSTAPLAHEWLAPGDPRAGGLLRSEFVLYTHRPLAPGTRHRVTIAGTRASGAPLSLVFSFVSE